MDRIECQLNKIYPMIKITFLAVVIQENIFIISTIGFLEPLKLHK
jgi:hypothetical protein